jgi:hypothetical protein
MLVRYILPFVLGLIVFVMFSCEDRSSDVLQPDINVDQLLKRYQGLSRSNASPLVYKGRAFLMPSDHGEVYVRFEGEGFTEFTMQGSDENSGVRLLESIKVIKDATIINSEFDVVVIDHDKGRGYVLATEGERSSYLENEISKEIHLTKFTGKGIIESNYLYSLLFENGEKSNINPWEPGTISGDCCIGPPITGNLSCKCVRPIQSSETGENVNSCEGGGEDSGECSSTAADGRECSVSKCRRGTFPCCNS